MSLASRPDPQAGQVIAKIKIAKYFPLTDSPNIMLAKFSRYTVFIIHLQINLEATQIIFDCQDNVQIRMGVCLAS